MNDCISSLRTSSRLKPSGIYCLTSDNLRISHSKQIELLCFHGVKLIQLRSKTLGYEDLVRETKISVEICNAYGVDLIVNDHPEIAAKCGAAGVHLGCHDVCPRQARKMLGDDSIVGVTVHSLFEANDLNLSDCDYAGLGPFRGTLTKPELKPQLSLNKFIEVISLLSPLPVYLIGGLDVNDFKIAKKIGAAGIALCSALFEGDKLCEDFITELVAESLSWQKNSMDFYNEKS